MGGVFVGGVVWAECSWADSREDERWSESAPCSGGRTTLGRGTYDSVSLWSSKPTADPDVELPTLRSGPKPATGSFRAPDYRPSTRRGRVGLEGAVEGGRPGTPDPKQPPGLPVVRTLRIGSEEGQSDGAREHDLGNDSCKRGELGLGDSPY